jgi:putative transposase
LRLTRRGLRGVNWSSLMHISASNRPSPRSLKRRGSAVACTSSAALAFAAKGQRQIVLALINTVFAQDDAKGAVEQWAAVVNQLRGKWPKLAKMMEDSSDDVLAFMTFPKVHRTQIATTNALERINAEVKRRTDVVGIFPNDAAARLVGTLLLEQNDEWQLQRRYMSLEGLQAVSENHNPGLSAVVTR